MYRKLLILIFIFTAIASSVASAYNQEDSARYVTDFPSLYAKSYTEVDHQAPKALLDQCKNQSSLAFTEVVVQSANTVISAAELQRQCGASSACILENGLTLEVNSSIKLHSLIVRNGATVRWSDNTQSSQNQWMCAGYIVVEKDGTWDMNLQDPSKRAWIYIMNNGAVHQGLRSRVFGSYTPPDEMHMGHMGMSMGPEPLPKLSVIGRELKRTWSLLAKPLVSGATSIQLMHNPIEMGWQVNDRIAIAPTDDRMQGEAQYFFIQSMAEDGVINLSQASKAYHEAEPIWTGKGVAALRSAEVINLTRNIIITGDDFEEVACDSSLKETFPGFGTSTQGCMCTSNRSSCTVGLQTASAHEGYAEIANVRVEKCGQRGVEGKYCLHFHHKMDCKNDENTKYGSNCIYRNNAIEASQQRGLIVHSTHNAIVESNVFYDVRGANLYLEDGNEMLNKVNYNVAICPWKDNGCTLPGTSNGQGDTSLNQSGLYMESPNNHFIGNRMANHFNGQFNNAGRGRGPVSGKVCGANTPLGIWDGNTFHSSGRFGTYLLNSNYPLQDTDQSVASNGTTNNSDHCENYTAGGEDKGLPSLILNHFDYGNNFVGQYEAGDIQYKQHVAVSNLNSIYWKETKTTEDGCSAQISDAFYKNGHLALPDAMGAFIIENTTLDDMDLGANHHCNVGVTGYLCMPNYIFDNVKVINGKNKLVDFDINNDSTNKGGIFSLSPADMAKNTPGNKNHFLLPPGYNSLVSTTFSYLLNLGKGCVTAASLGLGQKYEDGLLCPMQLEPLRIFAKGLPEGTTNDMVLEVWNRASGTLVTQQRVPHLHSANLKQGYAVPVVPGDDFQYKVRLLDGTDIPGDWIVDFGDLAASNRWGIQHLYIDIQGRQCNGTIYSNHDRRYYKAGNFLENGFNGWGHGACTQHPNMGSTDCSVLPDLAAKVEAANYDWRGELSTNCTANCGSDGVCSSTYLGANIPVLNQYACVCKNGWSAGGCEGQDLPDGSDDPSSGANVVFFSEAEDFTSMEGVQTQETADVSGSLNVGWIDAGDWMRYANLTIPKSGNYTVEYRVASPNAGMQIGLDLNDGSITLGSTTLPSTGGFQTWKTVSHSVYIEAGSYNVGISTSTGGFNLNWFRILGQIASSSSRAAISSSSTGSLSSSSLASSSLSSSRRSSSSSTVSSAMTASSKSSSNSQASNNSSSVSSAGTSSLAFSSAANSSAAVSSVASSAAVSSAAKSSTGTSAGTNSSAGGGSGGGGAISWLELLGLMSMGLMCGRFPRRIRLRS